jgi:hypothetical protein
MTNLAVIDVRSAWARPDARIFVQYGMRRSGNHAISDWLLRKLDVRYFNNIVPMRPIYAGKRSVPDLSDFFTWYISHRRRKCRSWHQRLLLQFARAPRRAYVTLEDLPVGLRAFAGNLPVNILVLRSFENMMSSRIRKPFVAELRPPYPRKMGPILRHIVETWKEHARCYLRLDGASRGRVAILFDAWFEDGAYREAICRRLDVPPGDEGINRVSGKGGGSSFSGVLYDGRANVMDVLQRAHALARHERSLLDRILEDAELRELSRRVSQASPVELL